MSVSVSYTSLSVSAFCLKGFEGWSNIDILIFAKCISVFYLKGFEGWLNIDLIFAKWLCVANTKRDGEIKWLSGGYRS